MNYVDPAEAGVDHRRLARLDEAIDRDLASGLYDGCVAIAARRSGVVFHGAFGYADKDRGRKMEKGNLFHSMSSGKQFVSALVLNRIERGDLRLTMPIREIIPEFGVNGKENVTLMHLLTHTGGILTDIPPGLTDQTIGDLEATMASINASQAVERPGKSVAYSAYAGHAVMAEMLRRLEGRKRPWREIMIEELFLPLGMKETAPGLPAARKDRVSPIRARGKYIRAEVQRLDAFITEKTEIPAGTYTLTAEDLSRFARALLNDGELDGFRLLSPAMLDLMSAEHTGATAQRAVTDWYSGRWPPAYGLGFMVRGPGIYPMAFGSMSTPTTFGGMGHASTMFWIDRQRDICMVFLSTGLIDDPIHIERCQRYSDIVLASLVRQ